MITVLNGCLVFNHHVWWGYIQQSYRAGGFQHCVFSRQQMGWWSQLTFLFFWRAENGWSHYLQYPYQYNIYIYNIIIFGCGSKCKVPIHTPVPHAIHTHDPYQNAGDPDRSIRPDHPRNDPYPFFEPYPHIYIVILYYIIWYYIILYYIILYYIILYI